MSLWGRFWAAWRAPGADYVQRIQALACAKTKPVIKPLALPPIQPLTARILILDPKVYRPRRWRF